MSNFESNDGAFDAILSKSKLPKTNELDYSRVVKVPRPEDPVDRMIRQIKKETTITDPSKAADYGRFVDMGWRESRFTPEEVTEFYIDALSEIDEAEGRT